ncbi:MAG TPA: cyclic nucleotide-binding domain-containing protein [Mycobacteriales bacterium]|nr:cyclic nucleotide-binding domain-containing protein [Mycobacteriales bacterium]
MAPDPAVVEALSSTDLFGQLNRRALNRVAEATRTVHHDAGKQLTTEGQEGVAFHLILEGTATVDIRGQARDKLGPGDYFGEISMIDGQPRSATVTVDTPMTTVALTSWDFRPLLDEEPSIAKALLLGMCARFRRSEAAASS